MNPINSMRSAMERNAVKVLQEQGIVKKNGDTWELIKEKLEEEGGEEKKDEKDKDGIFKRTLKEKKDKPEEQNEEKEKGKGKEKEEEDKEKEKEEDKVDDSFLVPFEGNLGAFGLSIFEYFACRECRHPYFGGKKDCAAGVEQSNKKKTDYECMPCVAARECGCAPENLTYKCMLCCSPATYYCLGTEFYCDRCHGDLRTVHPCPGPGKCPLGVEHPPNQVGTHGGGKPQRPFALSCGICGPIAKPYKGELGNFKMEYV